MDDSTLQTRPSPLWLFVLVLAANVLMSVLGNQFFYPSGMWQPVYQHSRGLVQPTLIWGAAFFLIVICGVLLGVGRQRPREVGLEWRKLPTAASVLRLLAVPSSLRSSAAVQRERWA